MIQKLPKKVEWKQDVKIDDSTQLKRECSISELSNYITLEFQIVGEGGISREAGKIRPK